MGALILLLLVTTRRIRSDQLAAIAASTQAHEQAPQPPAAAAPPNESATVEAPANPPTPEPPLTPVTVLPAAVDLPPSVSETPEPDRDADQAAIRAYEQKLQSELDKLQQSKDELQDQIAEVTDEQQRHADQVQQLRAQSTQITTQADDLQETKKRLTGQLAALRRAVRDAEAEPKHVESRFRIVPFDGRSGTIRRPIIVECLEDRFRFLPEGVEVTKVQLEGFLSGLNPLLSGTAALNAYWSKSDQDADTGEPYVLLVVRPGGSMGFYAARRLLSKLQVPIGYELLTEDQELDLPEADPEAEKVCRLAVEKTLTRREEIAALRPLARQYLAGRSSQTGDTPYRRHPTESGVSPDGRTESFRRLLEGVRTRNATRPEGFAAQSRTPGRASARGGGSASRGGDGAQSTATARSGDSEEDEPRHLPWVTANANPGSASGDTTESTQRQGLGELPEFTPIAPGRSGAAGGGAARGGGGSGSGRRDVADTAQPADADLPPPDPVDDALPNIRPDGPQGKATQQPTRPMSVTDNSTKPVDPRRNRAEGPAGLSGVPSQESAAGGGAPPLFRQTRTIRFRRAVSLYVDPGSVVVASNAPVKVDQSQTSGPWLGEILLQVDAEVRSWGPAPRGMSWSPEIRFRVSPGANRTHTRLRNAMNRLGMKSTDEFTLTPRQDEAGNMPLPSAGPQWEATP